MTANLSQLYYGVDQAGSFGGVKRLQNAAPKVPTSQIQSWLAEQLPYTLHRAVKRKFPRRPYIVRGLNVQFQADLVDMQHFAKENAGYRYILTCIDVFSRYAWVRALKSKRGEEVAEAISSIFEQENRIPKYFQTDQGLEFYNRHVKSLLSKHRVQLFSVHSEIKCALVERFNRTLKDKMYRYFTYTGRRRWVDELQGFVTAYNKTRHRSIHMAPIEVTQANESQVWAEQYGNVKSGNATKSKLKVGDCVRISKHAKTFNRGFTPNWSNEEFYIHTIDRKYQPLMYVLRDSENELLEGRFYRQELQKVANPKNIYLIEKIIKTRTRNKRKEALVKWKGYPQPEWIPHESITTLDKIP